MFEVIGQEFVLEAFNRAYKNNHLAHAYILLGEDGTGKSIFAMYMAAKLLCTGEDKPCMGCSACKKIISKNHPDLKILDPGNKTIGINDILNIIDDIYTKPYEGDRKVIIIKEAEKITIQGQNAILKTLEEPPEDATIIMITQNAGAILDTIQSRCQTLRFGRISVDRIRDYLTDKGIEESRASTAANLSDGIIGNALKYLDEKFMELRKNTVETAKMLVRLKGLDAYELVNFFTKNKDDIGEILDILITWFRDIMVIKLSKDKNLIINSDFYNVLVEESKFLSYNKLNGIIEIINDTKEKLRQYSNFQLTMEVMVLNIQEV